MDPGAILRYGVQVGTRYILALLLVGACQAPVDHTGFGSMPDVTTAPAASTGGSSGSSGTSTGEDSGSGGGSADSTSGQLRDLGGMPDFGNDSRASVPDVESASRGAAEAQEERTRATLVTRKTC